jgi:hypothetical protein
MSILKTQSKHEDSFFEPFHAAKAKLEQIEADAKKKGIEVAALTGLAVTKRHIDRKLEDYKKAHESNRPHARAEIAAEVATFLAAVDEVHKKHAAAAAKK